MFGRKRGASVITQAYIAPGMSVKSHTHTPPRHELSWGENPSCWVMAG